MPVSDLGENHVEVPFDSDKFPVFLAHLPVDFLGATVKAADQRRKMLQRAHPSAVVGELVKALVLVVKLFDVLRIRPVIP